MFASTVATWLSPLAMTRPNSKGYSSCSILHLEPFQTLRKRIWRATEMAMTLPHYHLHPLLSIGILPSLPWSERQIFWWSFTLHILGYLLSGCLQEMSNVNMALFREFIGVKCTLHSPIDSRWTPHIPHNSINSRWSPVKTCGKAENDKAKSGIDEAKGVPGRQGVTEGDRMMWRRFDEEEKCWRVWGRWKTGVIRWWQTRPQLMCCALACGTRCPLISGARKTMRMTENKARMYRFLSITNWSLAEAQEFLIYRNTEINRYWTQEYEITKNKVIRSEEQ